MISHNIKASTDSGIFGAVDDVRATGASGWLIDTSRIATNHKINAFLNDELIGSTTTSILRKDISSIIKHDVHCGFNIQWNSERLAQAIKKPNNNANLELRFELDGDTRKITILQPPNTQEIKAWATTNKIFGNLDCIDSNLIAHGWAIDIREEGKTTVQILVNGQLAATSEAKLARADLVALKPSQILSGYKISIPPALIETLSFQVAAHVDGHPLPGSPLTVDLSQSVTISSPEIIKGYLKAKLFGWPGEKISAEIHVNGEFESNVIFEKDKENPSSKSAYCSWKIPSQLADGHPKVYSIIIKDPGTVVRSDATQLSYPDYKLHIDTASHSLINGWAFSNDHHEPLNLSLWSEKKLICSTQSNIDRHDVQEAHSTSHEKCGFSFQLPRWNSAEQAEYILKDADTDIALAKIYVTTPYESLTRLASEIARSPIESSLATLKTLISRSILKQTKSAIFTAELMPITKKNAHNDYIDVVIPIYGGASETIECIESVLAAKNNKKARFVLINDCTPDPLIVNYLRTLEARAPENLLIVHRKVNGGFSEAVNIGFSIAGDRDVILLNADTVVQNNWIDRICAAADLDSRIGTITPLSNNAEICTIPYICKSLNVADIDFATQVDLKASLVNDKKIIDIPVAIGFCMFIRRECLNEVGFFDAAKWGRGYGEEVDFCMKASAQGWRHTMLGDTFVVHRGNVSFGDEKLERVKESARKISEIYPFYDGLIQRFLASDPSRELRRKLNLSLIADLLPTTRVLHLSHSFGGGTEQYVQDMATLNIEENLVPILLKFDSDGSSTLSFDMTNHDQDGFFMKKHCEHYSPEETKSLIEDLSVLNLSKVHIHSPYGTPSNLLDWLSTNHPYIITVHDYSWICPQITLCPGGTKYEGDEAHDCTICINLYKPHPGLKGFITDDKSIFSYRQNFQALFAKAQVILAGASDVKERMIRFGMTGNYKVIPHATPTSSIYHKIEDLPAASISGPIKVALIGGISDIKGYFTLIECAREAQLKNQPIEFIVFGHTMDDHRLEDYKNVKVLGKYKDSELYSLISLHRPHLAFFPSNCPETFSYTLSHAMRLGLWPITPDIGAPAERIRLSKFGTTYTNGMPTTDLLHLLISEALKCTERASLRPAMTYVSYPTSYSDYIASP